MSTENNNIINWEHEAASAPITSWADFEEEEELLNSSSPVDSQPSEEVKFPLNSSGENEEDMSSTYDRSPQTESFGDRMPRSSSHNSFPRSNSSQKLSKDAESYTPPKPSVKEQIPFPTVAPFVAFVSNLHLDATQRNIHQAFESVSGAPKTIKIILEKSTGLPRGFCYVEFSTSESLRKAIESDGLIFMSQPLHIVVADQKKEKPSRTNTRRSETKSHDSNKGRHPQMDSVSLASKGKSDSWRMREETKPRSHDRSSKSNPPRETYREKKPSSVQVTTNFNGYRKVEEYPRFSNNMFSSLRMEGETM